jgi:monoamine oxidase
MSCSAAGHEPLIWRRRTGSAGAFKPCASRSPTVVRRGGRDAHPQAHALTLAYIEKFGLATAPFTMGNGRGFYYLNGQRHRIAEADVAPSVLLAEAADHERTKTSTQLWEEAIRPLADKLSTGGEAAWVEIVREYDHFSTREFLEHMGWSEAAIEVFGLLANQEALMQASFLELLREEVGCCYTNMVAIEGGTDLLPRAFLPALKERIRFGARVIAIDQSDDDVTLHFRTRAGTFRETGDFAIVTLPFPVLRHVEVLKSWSRAKRRAIRQLYYDASAKIFAQCRRRFWEEDDGIFGGGTITDLPIRNLYYPEHGRDTGRGVLLASYTWSEDAQRWGSLPPDERVSEAIENVAAIHPQIRDTSRLEPRKFGTMIRTRAARSPCSIPASKRCSTRPSARPRAAFCSPVSTRRCVTPGFKAPSSPV